MEDDEFLEELAHDYLENEHQEVGIQIGFNLATMLDCAIDGHRYFNDLDQECMDIDSKPIFDKVKQDLLQLIETIDSFKYGSD